MDGGLPGRGGRHCHLACRRDAVVDHHALRCTGVAGHQGHIACAAHTGRTGQAVACGVARYHRRDVQVLYRQGAGVGGDADRARAAALGRGRDAVGIGHIGVLAGGNAQLGHIGLHRSAAGTDAAACRQHRRIGGQGACSAADAACGGFDEGVACGTHIGGQHHAVGGLEVDLATGRCDGLVDVDVAACAISRQHHLACAIGIDAAGPAGRAHGDAAIGGLHVHATAIAGAGRQRHCVRFRDELVACRVHAQRAGVGQHDLCARTNRRACVQEGVGGAQQLGGVGLGNAAAGRQAQRTGRAHAAAVVTRRIASHGGLQVQAVHDQVARGLHIQATVRAHARDGQVARITD